MKHGLLSCLFLFICSQPAAANAPGNTPFVLLISVDGMKPEAVIAAPSHGLKVPNLRSFMTEGAYADGVRGVLPTLTYPSHTTLLTGASPGKHGIFDNTTFDPLLRNQRGWYWYAEDIKVPTLWDAAAAAHLKTANVYWPVSVGANIAYNLPQIWRAGTNDDLKLQRALSTPGLEQELSAGLGRYPGGMEETVAEDEVRARFAIRLLEKKHPSFLTVYLTGLDTEEHLSGPFSPKSNQTLERLDAVVGSLRAAAEKAAPGRATVCVVSDHGFAAIEHDVNLYAAFREAGLFSVDKDNQLTGWRAMLWPAGGSAAVMLADPKDEQLRAQVKTLLDKLAGDPVNGIDRIWSREEIGRAGGFPQAAFLVSLKIGYEMAYGLSLPLITKPSNLGMHGYVPERPEMRSSFFIVGPQISKGRSLGEIDMRQIAPTIAAILRIRLSGAEMAALALN
ncbi:MAG TPA: ectonucleotide pyrophosphatase/phosphodiesterase [Steroidobacteraceae bacterium]|jgi:predicted AlkP superfamily pyrophosphatase or phosphodiesterase|nr:ectonucleotide pyrophosphatase/phosphodiesterase [Steroidobacteraceae bacterium]